MADCTDRANDQESPDAAYDRLLNEISTTIGDADLSRELDAVVGTRMSQAVDCAVRAALVRRLPVAVLNEQGRAMTHEPISIEPDALVRENEALRTALRVIQATASAGLTVGEAM